MKGKKESEGKLGLELDWSFIRAMAERMDSADKYPAYNWHEPINNDELKNAAMRHMLAIMEGEFEDEGREYGHLEAVATNMMMLYYQLNNYEES